MHYCPKLLNGQAKPILYHLVSLLRMIKHRWGYVAPTQDRATFNVSCVQEMAVVSAVVSWLSVANNSTVEDSSPHEFAKTGKSLIPTQMSTLHITTHAHIVVWPLLYVVTLFGQYQSFFTDKEIQSGIQVGAESP